MFELHIQTVAIKCKRKGTYSLAYLQSRQLYMLESVCEYLSIHNICMQDHRSTVLNRKPGTDYVTTTCQTRTFQWEGHSTKVMNFSLVVYCRWYLNRPRSETDNALSSVCLSVRLSVNAITAKNNESHYQSKVFVCNQGA